jgi:hypothetical protein
MALLGPTLTRMTAQCHGLETPHGTVGILRASHSSRAAKLEAKCPQFHMNTCKRLIAQPELCNHPYANVDGRLAAKTFLVFVLWTR